jgi:hypothetical protein
MLVLGPKKQRDLLFDLTIKLDGCTIVLNTAARILTITPKLDPNTPVLASLQWLPVKARAGFKVLLLSYKVVVRHAPTYRSDLVLLYIPTRTLWSQDTGLLFSHAFLLKRR